MSKSELPSGWKSVKLGDVCEIIMGQSPSSEFYNTCSVGIPLIQGNADIKNRKTIIRTFTSQVTKTAQKGDIIMSVRAPVGEIATTAFDCCIGRGVCAIRGNLYIYYFLEFFESKWYRLSQGSTFDSITGELLNNLPIPFPPIPEQHAIAEILTTADKLIEVNECLIAAKQKQKQWLMQNLLTGKIRLQGFSGEWERVKLGNITDIDVGQSPNNTDIGCYPFINAGTTPSGYLAAYNTEPDTITTPSRGQGGIGFVSYQSEYFWCGPLSYRIRSKNKALFIRYLYYWLSNSIEHIIGMAHMSGLPALNKKELIGLYITLPPLPEQQAIASVLSTADREIDLLKKELEQQKQIKKYLMQKLLTGKIRVKGADA